MNSIKLIHLTFAYMKKPTLFSDVNFELNSGVAFVMGEKGSGKTTLLEILCGLNDMALGKVLVNGKPAREQSRKISYLPSTPVVLPDKTVFDNLKFACDAIDEDYSKIDEDDKWIKANKSVKAKKLAPIDKFILSTKRVEIKNSNVVFIDASDDVFTQEDYVCALSKLQHSKRLLVISVSPETFKKLQNLTKTYEILYINTQNIEKFLNFDSFKNNVKFSGMADYLQLEKHSAVVSFNQNGYYLVFGERTIKLKEKYIKKIESYFEVSSETDVLLYGQVDDKLSDEQFNNKLDSGELMLFDRLSFERL